MKTIPIFFAVDNNYFPYMAVTLKSLLENASPKYFYKFHVLSSSDLNPEWKQSVEKCLTPYSSIEYFDVRPAMEKIKQDLHVRDYYSLDTYNRFFIDTLFPQYDKVIYLDADIVVTGDISKLYRKNISNYLVGCVPEQVMQKYKVFGEYVVKVLGVKLKTYFNAGMLLMNTKMFRAYNVQKRFINLLKQYKFRVTQDEDYLNVICQNKTRILDFGWNKMPFDDKKFNCRKVNLIHYNLNWKPWRYKHVIYEEEFWKYAKMTDFYEMIKKGREDYTYKQKMDDTTQFENLKKLAQSEIDNPNNYKNVLDMKTSLLKKGTQLFLNLPGIKSLYRFINSNGYKIAYVYRKRQRKTRRTR